MNCTRCEADLSLIRASKRYCNATCRKAAWRLRKGLSVADKHLSVAKDSVSVADLPLSVAKNRLSVAPDLSVSSKEYSIEHDVGDYE